MENIKKLNFIIYGLLSAFLFSYLVMPENAGISVPIFTAIQLVLLYFVVPDRKKLIFYAPIFLISLNPFLSASGIWDFTNFIVIIFLFSALLLDFDIRDTTSDYFVSVLENVFNPLRHFAVPVTWLKEIKNSKVALLKRILLAALVTLPCIIVITALLSFADMIFSHGVLSILNNIEMYISFNVLFKIAWSIFFGFYLFGLVYTAHLREESKKWMHHEKKHDFLIITVLLISILIIYTIFVIIQFRYLFAGSALPYGLTYTEYARKGFFELLILSGVNVLIILFSVNFSTKFTGIKIKIIKTLCAYLCTVTVIMLVSSFYRMMLYGTDDGLTRLRFFVFGFLIFECIGLLITYFYIFKPKFNIVAVYFIIALIYYVALNLVPTDYFVAKNQVDRYQVGKKAGIDYIVTLSPDASVQIARLLSSNDPSIRMKAEMFFKNNMAYYNNFVPRWQRFNLSVTKMYTYADK